MKLKKIGIVAKVISFLLIFVLIFNYVQDLVIDRGEINYQNITGFYAEKENSLDAVYIGSSNCFVYWNSAFAWEEYGLCIYPFASNSQSFFSTEYLIKEAVKYQKDALFIVNINTLTKGDVKMTSIYNLTTSMPFSLNKLALIRHLTKTGDYSFSDSLEYYFPIIRYHNRITELEENDFGMELNGYKGSSVYSPYLNRSEDISKKYIITDNTSELTDKVLKVVDSMLDFCDEKELNVLFITVPQAKSKGLVTRYNALNELLESRGYPVLSLIDKVDEIGLDTKIDFYNEAHTNIHGSAKFTYYLSEYLIENYGFKDKRENEEYKDWQTAYELYMKRAGAHILDVELDSVHRDYSLSVPKLKLSAENNGVKIDWTESENAKGYTIYRKKTYSGIWEKISDCENFEYIDTNVDKGNNYFYTVVPFTEKDSQRYYGNHSYSGEKIKYN